MKILWKDFGIMLLLGSILVFLGLLASMFLGLYCFNLNAPFFEVAIAISIPLLFYFKRNNPTLLNAIVVALLFLISMIVLSYFIIESIRTTFIGFFCSSVDPKSVFMTEISTKSNVSETDTITSQNISNRSLETISNTQRTSQNNSTEVKLFRDWATSSWDQKNNYEDLEYNETYYKKANLSQTFFNSVFSDFSLISGPAYGREKILYFNVTVGNRSIGRGELDLTETNKIIGYIGPRSDIVLPLDFYGNETLISKNSTEVRIFKQWILANETEGHRNTNVTESFFDNFFNNFRVKTLILVYDPPVFLKELVFSVNDSNLSLGDGFAELTETNLVNQYNGPLNNLKPSEYPISIDVARALSIESSVCNNQHHRVNATNFGYTEFNVSGIKYNFLIVGEICDFKGIYVCSVNAKNGTVEYSNGCY